MIKKLTLESLATMIMGEFSRLREEISKDFTTVRKDIHELKGEVSEINQRLENYYAPTLKQHARRIKRLET